jgi:competence protein ComEC
VAWGLFSSPSVGELGKGRLKISFYDVGQGDAILIEKGDWQILVDGGPDEAVLSWVGKSLAPWDRRLELVVLTHPHADHLTGLLSILERYRVGGVLFYPIHYETEIYQKFLERLQSLAKGGINLWKAERGTKITTSQMTIEVLWPPPGFSDEKVNNNSLVLGVSFGEFEALLLGDVEREVQRELLPSVGEVEVVKVAHQGARDSLYPLFLERLSPELAIISVGENRYGHPDEEVLRFLDRLGVAVERTDQRGTIEVVSDGERFWYTSEKGR